ncbi:MAG TPA: ABC transporter ATP-binding protein [Aurantimonas sp.]|jgi:ABC-2 type transport system ATP-binding protein|nr:ABC transporter ATP-binding protein [Aurantimonas sp.]
MPAEAALRVTGLTRSFGGKRAVDGVDLTVERGEIMGFLGPNGAGKTTLMNMVMGLLTPDGGEIELLGVRGGAKHRGVRLRVGYLQEKPRIYPEMSAQAYLDLFAQLYGVASARQRVGDVIERVGLADAADRPLSGYSRGMQQRACLARVILHEPEFLLLDEPTLGLDPAGVSQMRDILREMRASGTTLFFSSHQLAEMERICDRVAFMKDGRVVAVGRPSELVPAVHQTGSFLVELFEPVADHADAIRSLALVRELRVAGRHQAEIVVSEAASGDSQTLRAAIVRELAGLSLTVLAVGVTAPSLEDLFLSLTQTSPERH